MSNNNEKINHPAHYGGDTVYEHIKVVEAWGLIDNYCLGIATKHICRAGKKDGSPVLEDLKKARWYLDYEIKRLELAEAVLAVSAPIDYSKSLPQNGALQDRPEEVILGHIAETQPPAAGGPSPHMEIRWDQQPIHTFTDAVEGEKWMANVGIPVQVSRNVRLDEFILYCDRTGYLLARGNEYCGYWHIRLTKEMEKKIWSAAKA